MSVAGLLSALALSSRPEVVQLPLATETADEGYGRGAELGKIGGTA